jgi:micrococcal nuclease
MLEKDTSERDRYGRLLRDVWVERDGAWTLVGLALVAEGYALVSTFPPDVKYVDALVAAARMAREQGLGLWSAPARPRP